LGRIFSISEKRFVAGENNQEKRQKRGVKMGKFLDNLFTDSNDVPASDLEKSLFYGKLFPDLKNWPTAGYGTLHIWIKCVNKEMRGFLVHEGTHMGIHSISSDITESEFLKVFNFHIDGKSPHTFRFSPHGAEFFASLDIKDKSFLIIDANGWLHSLSFPTQSCIAKTELPKAKKTTLEEVSPTVVPAYIMSVWNWDNDQKAPSLERMQRSIALTAQHFAFHHCLLPLQKYHITIRREQLEDYKRNAILQGGISQGLIHFFTKTHSFMQSKLVINSWQSIYENLVILHYWGEDVRILFLDNDEFLHLPATRNGTGNALNWFHRQASFYSRIYFPRSHIYCLDCPKYKYHISMSSTGASAASSSRLRAVTSIPAEQHAVFQGHSFVEEKVCQSQLPGGRSMMDPNRVGMMNIHRPFFSTSNFDMPRERSVVYHYAPLAHSTSLSLQQKLHEQYNPTNKNGLVPTKIGAVSNTVAHPAGSVSSSKLNIEPFPWKDYDRLDTSALLRCEPLGYLKKNFVRTSPSVSPEQAAKTLSLPEQRSLLATTGSFHGNLNQFDSLSGVVSTYDFLEMHSFPLSIVSLLFVLFALMILRWRILKG
jgi:hypothetical protein